MRWLSLNTEGGEIEKEGWKQIKEKGKREKKEGGIWAEETLIQHCVWVEEPSTGRLNTDVLAH